jgi:hypothetical protein
VESILGSLGTSTTEWPIVPAPGDCDDDGEFGGMKIVVETDVLGEHLPQHHSVRQKSHLPDPGLNPGCHGGKPVTNLLSYGTACMCVTMYYVRVPLCVVFLSQVCVSCIDLLMYLCSLLCLLVMYLLLSVIEFVYYFKYGIVCQCVCRSYVNYFY